MLAMVTHQDEAHSDLEYLLLDDLFELLEEPADAENRRAILALLEFLLTTGREAFSAMDESDVSSELLSSSQWRRQIIGLHADRDRLYAQLDSLNEQLQNCRNPRESVNAARDAVLVWINRLQRHRRQRLRVRRESAPRLRSHV
ncbi:MAG: hypothetical protein KF774_17145 [Planctomyces sp.]|nr:hypothetical protein [Planctomyces sp.]